jgi:2-keto-4-pentenoate hydratase/2-oxohepta-3-ene-1,7-dioic acid hydratase in catechol pathway
MDGRITYADGGSNMKLLTFQTENGLQLGVKTEKGILNISKALNGISSGTPIPTSIKQMLEGGAVAVAALSSFVNQVLQSGNMESLEAEESLRLGPCVTNPGKIICVGTNYRKHAEELSMPIPEIPLLFSKFNNTISASGDEIQLPFNSEQIDYEAELCIVIGKKAKRVAKEDALQYVFGYCNVNDLSARDLQFRTHQWLLGKTCDGFSPVGPYLVTSDEVGNPNELGIRTHVNGEIRQNSNTSDMIFHCDEIISYVSQHMTLESGDIILTGTPEGVIVGYPKEKQVWLKDGDEVTIEIDKLGRLTNRLRREV